MSVELVGNCINKAYRNNLITIFIIAFFIFILIVAGIVFGALAINVKVDWAYFEIFVVPVLWYMIKCIMVLNHGHSEILDKAKVPLQIANDQNSFEQAIREEKESEKQKRRIK